MSEPPKEVVELRRAERQDDAAIERLAQRDSAQAPPRPLLLAFQRRELRAAISLSEDRRVIADPFARTDHLVEMLRVQAAQYPTARSPMDSSSRQKAARGIQWLGRQLAEMAR